MNWEDKVGALAGKVIQVVSKAVSEEGDMTEARAKVEALLQVFGRKAYEEGRGNARASWSNRPAITKTSCESFPTMPIRSTIWARCMVI